MGSSGHLFLATDRGLFKFDGQSFMQVHSEMAFKNISSNITQILEVEKGYYWLVVDERELVEFNEKKNTLSNISFYIPDWAKEKVNGFQNLKLLEDGRIALIGSVSFIFDHKDAKPTPYNFVTQCFDFFPITDSTFIAGIHSIMPVQILFGRKQRGYHFLERKTFVDTLAFSVNTLVKDREEEYWVGAWLDQLIRLNTMEASIETFPIPLYGDINPADVEINELHQSQNHLWVGTRRAGLYLFDKEQGEFVDLSTLNLPPQMTVEKVIHDKQDNIWVASSTHGLFKLSPIPDYINNFNFDRTIQVLCLEKVEDEVWVGCKNGIHVIQKDGAQDFSYLNYRGRNLHVYCIYKDEIHARILIGTNAGIFEIDKSSFRINPLQASGVGYEFLVIDNLQNTLINDLQTYVIPKETGFYVDAQKNKFYTSDSIFLEYGLAKDTSYLYEIRSGSHAEVSNTVLLASCYGNGLVVIDEKNHLLESNRLYTEEFVSLQTNKLNKIYVDPDQKLWMLTEFNGTWKSANLFAQFIATSKDAINKRTFDYQPYYCRPYNKSNLNGTPYESDGVVDMDYLYDGSYLLTSSSGELLELNINENKIEKIDLDGQRIDGIVLDEKIYVFTEEGVGTMSLEYENFVGYNSSHGLEHSGVDYFFKDGALILLGEHGVSWIDPIDSLNLIQAHGSFYLQSLKVKGEPIDVNHSMTMIELPYHKNSFSLSAGVLDLHSTEEQKFAYKLSGHSNDWIYSTGDINLFFDQINPGNYDLELKYKNGQQRWSPVNNLLSIQVNPPFWKTSWFIISALALVLCVLYQLHRFSLARQRRMSELELKTTIEAQEAERKRLAEDLHDDFGMRISALKMYMDTIEHSLDESTDEVQSLTRSATKIVDESMKDLRNLLTNLSPSSLEQYGLIAAIEELILRINKLKKIKIVFNNSYLTKYMEHGFELNLFRIIQELLNNSIKHARCENISLSIVEGKDKIQFSYKDDGIGFDPTAKEEGYGIKNIHRRVELHQGNILWKNNSSDGTNVTIDFPKIKQHEKNNPH